MSCHCKLTCSPSASKVCPISGRLHGPPPRSATSPAASRVRPRCRHVGFLQTDLHRATTALLAGERTAPHQANLLACRVRVSVFGEVSGLSHLGELSGHPPCVAAIRFPRRTSHRVLVLCCARRCARRRRNGRRCSRERPAAGRKQAPSMGATIATTGKSYIPLLQVGPVSGTNESDLPLHQRVSKSGSLGQPQCAKSQKCHVGNIWNRGYIFQHSTAWCDANISQ
jgi:hypothetical protein